MLCVYNLLDSGFVKGADFSGVFRNVLGEVQEASRGIGGRHDLHVDGKNLLRAPSHRACARYWACGTRGRLQQAFECRALVEHLFVAIETLVFNGDLMVLVIGVETQRFPLEA